jgi:putative hydrolase of the HAD superfamily
VQALTELRGRGFRLGLVSNVWIPPGFCRLELQREGFGELLDFAVFSSEVGFRKPSPVIYEAGLRAAFPAGRPRNLSGVLFVGDSPSCDVIAPARLGMKTVLVECVPGIWPEMDHAAARPDLRVKAVAELPAALGGEGPVGIDRPSAKTA